MPDPARLGIRVNLTLPVEVIEVLDRICAVTGHGRATVIRGWMEEGLPQFEQVADALELIQKSPADSLKSMAKSMRETAAQAEQMELDIKTQRRALMRRKRGRAT